MKPYYFVVNVRDGHISFVDNTGAVKELEGYAIFLAAKDGDSISTYGDSDAISRAVGNAYGSSREAESPLKNLFDKIVSAFRFVSHRIQQEISAEEAFAEDCDCTGDGGCVCDKKKVFH